LTFCDVVARSLIWLKIWSAIRSFYINATFP
jgi:hypothetical protein